MSSIKGAVSSECFDLRILYRVLNSRLDHFLQLACVDCSRFEVNKTLPFGIRNFAYALNRFSVSKKAHDSRTVGPDGCCGCAYWGCAYWGAAAIIGFIWGATIRVGGATITTGTVTTTINDDGTGGPPGTDNDTPVLSIADISVAEGASAVFTVSISNPSTSAVVFTPSLANGTATLGTDTAAAGTSAATSGRLQLGVQQRHRRCSRVDCGHR